MKTLKFNTDRPYSSTGQPLTCLLVESSEDCNLVYVKDTVRDLEKIVICSEFTEESIISAYDACMYLNDYKLINLCNEHLQGC